MAVSRSCWRVKDLEASLWSEAHRADHRKVLTPSPGCFRGQVVRFVDDGKRTSWDRVTRSLFQASVRVMPTASFLIWERSENATRRVKSASARSVAVEVPFVDGW